MFVTLAADAAFDLANVLVFHGGMLSMALATSLSNCLGLCVLLTHFSRKDRILHFTLQGLRAGDLKDVVLCGIPSVISMGSQVVR
jgi:Na+-driven multidrug efflux pump